MITSFEVGTVFKIVDRATPVLRGLIADMTRLEAVSGKTKQNFQTLGTLKLGNLNRAVSGLTDQAIRMQDTFGKAFSEISTETDASIKQARSLAAEWRNVAQAARSAGIAAGAARRVGSVPSVPLTGAGGHSGAGGGRGGFRFHLAQHGNLPGGGRFGVSGGGLGENLALAAAGAFGYGVYQEGELEGTIARMMLAAGKPLSSSMMSTPLAAAIRKAIQGGMIETGLSARELEGSAMKLTLQMGGIPFKQRVALLPSIFRFAGIESQLKGVDAADATQSLVGLLHMTGAYKPADIQKLASQFAFASTISPVGLPGIERAASYVLPLAVNTLGLDPSSLLLVMAQAQSAGILSGKSGTWFQGMLQALSPRAGFASLLTGHGAAGRRMALQQLGLVDQGGAPTGLRLLEKNDWAGFIKTVHNNLAKYPQEQWMGIESQAMGSVQAARGLATLMLPAMIQLLPELQKEQREFAQDPAKTLNGIFAASPVMQFKRTWEQLSVVLMDLGDAVLPPLLVGLRDLDGLLKDLEQPITWLRNHWPAQGSFGGLPKQGSLGEALGKGMIGGGTLGGAIGFFSPVPGGTLLGGAIGGFVGGAYEGGKYLLFGAPSDNSGTNSGTIITVPVPKSNAAPIGPAIGGFHKTAYLVDPSALQRQNTWSDIGQGFGESSSPIIFSGSGGGGGSVGGFPVIKASLGALGSGGVPVVTGGGAGAVVMPLGNLPISGLGANAYVAARRARFTQELKDPNKRLQFAAMLLSEAGQKQAGDVATAESAMNRSDFTHKTLMQMLHSGFYGPINRGQLPAFMARLKRDPKLMARMNTAIDIALGGSDTISGFTDQGMPSDPNGPWIMRHGHKIIGGNVFGDWGGGGGHAASQRWRQQFEAGRMTSFKPPHWTVGDINHAVYGSDSTVVPPSKHSIHTTPVTMIMDGRVVAHSTMKHIIREANGPARGPRIADYTSVRPINV